jgi:hypothetical protein
MYFECGQGWAPLIGELSDKIEAIIRKNPEEYEDVYVDQVKEKWGGLRFYMTYYTKEIDDLKNKYKEKSYEICERCGEKGKMRPDIWLQVMCDKCYDE